jgi:hypothetical protein
MAIWSYKPLLFWRGVILVSFLEGEASAKEPKDKPSKVGVQIYGTFGTLRDFSANGFVGFPHILVFGVYLECFLGGDG